MVLVVFLLAYLVRRRLDAANAWSGDSLWRALFQWNRRAAADREPEHWKGLMLVAVPALAIALGEWYLEALDWRMAAYPFELLLLVLLMGAPGWGSTLDAYSASWSRGDMQAAWHHIKDRLPAAERGAAVSPEEMHVILSRTLMVTLFERYFLVAFWYVAAGPAAAFFASGMVALRDHWPRAAARSGFARLAEVVNWLPGRMLSLTFGVAGDLAGWLNERRDVLLRWSLTTDQVLMAAANGALTGYALDPARFAKIHPDGWASYGERSLAAIRDLLNRSMLVWLCVLALLVIAGIR